MSDPTISSQPTLHPNESRSFFCVHHLKKSLVLLFLLITLIVAIPRLILHPVRPVFFLDSLSISNFTLSNSRVTADYAVELTITNPNKKVWVFIYHFHVPLLYETALLSKGSTEPVFLKKMSQQTLSPRFSKDLLGQFVDEKVFNHIRKDWSKRVLNLHVIMEIKTRFTYENWTAKETGMKVSCNNLNVSFLTAKGSVTGTGQLRGGGKKCAVEAV